MVILNIVLVLAFLVGGVTVLVYVPLAKYLGWAMIVLALPLSYLAWKDWCDQKKPFRPYDSQPN